MYKLQVFCVLVLTLFVFSQEHPTPSKKDFITAALKDLASLKQMKKVQDVKSSCGVPINVPDIYITKALDCYIQILAVLQEKLKRATDATNTISNIKTNLEAIMEVNSKSSKKNQCLDGSIKRKWSNTTEALEDLNTLLQRMNNEQ